MKAFTEDCINMYNKPITSSFETLSFPSNLRKIEKYSLIDDHKLPVLAPEKIM